VHARQEPQVRAIFQPSALTPHSRKATGKSSCAKATSVIKIFNVKDAALHELDVMATAPLASTEHLEQHDLGPEFTDLLPAFMEVVDSIGFKPDPDSPFEICKDDRLISAAAPLLQKLQSAKVLITFLVRNIRLIRWTEILGRSASHTSTSCYPSESNRCSIHRCSSSLRNSDCIRKANQSWAEYIS
jgi:hypothetical protein